MKMKSGISACVLWIILVAMVVIDDVESWSVFSLRATSAEQTATKATTIVGSHDRYYHSHNILSWQHYPIIRKQKISWWNTRTDAHLTALEMTSDDTQSLPRRRPTQPPSPLAIHHTAIKTHNITLAIQFYSLLGFHVITRFRAGPARAAWLKLDSDDDDDDDDERRNHSYCSLELIEVPSFVLQQQPEATEKSRAVDLMQRQDLLGHNHFALDVSDQIAHHDEIGNLTDWLQALNQTSINTFNRMLRVALEPRQQLIGQTVYELAFLYDADGALVELLHKQTELKQTIQSGWEPWDGKGFLQSKNV